MTTDTLLATHRALRSRLLAVLLLGLAAAAALAALAVEQDAVDTVLGVITGASLVLGLFSVLLQVLGVRSRRREAAEADRARLDGLEPLRAARRDGVDGHAG